MEDAMFNAGKTKTAKEQVANPLIDNGLKLLPSVTRVFSRSRDMYVYFQAYEREAESTQPLGVFVTFFRGQEKVYEMPFTLADGMDPSVCDKHSPS
jgi:hypothetical protein